MNETRHNAKTAFQAFEYTGWQRVPAVYDEAFSGLTTQSATALLDAAEVGTGSRTLDVATGAGHVAALAAERAAAITGLDFAPAMVAHARARFPDLTFVEGDAAALPFGDSSFDAVTMNFGLLHMDDPETAVREAWRVLRSRGRFAFTVWAPPDEAVGFGIAIRAVAAHGTFEVSLPSGPDFFHFSDPTVCEQMLAGAGFVAPSTARVPQTWYLDSAEELFERLFTATVRTAGLLQAQSAEDLDAIRTAMCAEAQRYRENGKIALPMPAVLTAAEKP
jgi:SAM-dependent methyltransferase